MVDFSNNQLKECPNNLDHAKCTVVLNLSHNNIEQIPSQVFANMVDLMFLDVSHNKIEMIPPQIRRLTELQTLILDNNPLQHFHVKQLPVMNRLRVLSMKNTQRNSQNIPPTFETFPNLEEVDFSCNDLQEVPDAIFRLKNLRKLNLSDNEIVTIVCSWQPQETTWPNMEVLNLSRYLRILLSIKIKSNFFC